ncbi:MAG TPA: glycosyltransferase [Nitrososphaeraceae archaeon]|nr:glycosyltransferase [Nitrososphaeraceae archaeon]
MVNIVHINLNARGGSERLALAVIRALKEDNDMDIDIDLTTLQKPDVHKIEETYGKTGLMAVRNINRVNIIPSIENVQLKKKYDLIINTHGDMFPFSQKDFSKDNAITYCHFPLAKYLIDVENEEYARLIYGQRFSDIVEYKKHLHFARNSYIYIIRNSTVFTNSEYSRKAIYKTFKIDSIVLSPPVDVDIFRKAVLFSSMNKRDDTILVISRFHPSKKVENAIRLAELLKQKGIGRSMKIVGNLSPHMIGYYSYLRQMVQDQDLSDYVTFHVNVSFNKLLSLMSKSKVYFHPLPGEPFGISTVEAMSAGLIPVVPDLGGHTEFVPLRYQFCTFLEAMESVAVAMDASFSERIRISDSVKRFSTSNYIRRFQQIAKKLLLSTTKTNYKNIKSVSPIVS